MNVRNDKIYVYRYQNFCNVRAYVCVCVLYMSSDLDSRHNMSDFGTRLVATYLGSWPGCSWHGRRQDCTGGPPFAFRVPPFFSSCCEVSLAPDCGNHAHARACACATTATSHAWAPTRLHGNKRGFKKIVNIYL